MDAFWSGTDNANENMTQFYGVWGKINDAQPKFLFRWVSGESKVNIDPSILFDYPIVETKTVITKTVPGFEPEVTEKVEYESFKGPWENVDVPEDWIGQHKKKYAYSYKPGSQKPGTYNYGGAGYKYQGYGNHADAYDYYKEDSFYDKKNEQSASKKNETSEKIRTEADIVLEKIESEDKSIAETEEIVSEVISRLIDAGYDHIISNEMEDKSRYSHSWTGYHGYDY